MKLFAILILCYQTLLAFGGPEKKNNLPFKFLSYSNKNVGVEFEIQKNPQTGKILVFSRKSKGDVKSKEISKKVMRGFVFKVGEIYSINRKLRKGNKVSPMPSCTAKAWIFGAESVDVCAADTLLLSYQRRIESDFKNLKL
jgi:hypothetical protein